MNPQKILDKIDFDIKKFIANLLFFIPIFLIIGALLRLNFEFGEYKSLLYISATPLVLRFFFGYKNASDASKIILLILGSAWFGVLIGFAAMDVKLALNKTEVLRGKFFNAQISGVVDSVDLSPTRCRFVVKNPRIQKDKADFRVDALQLSKRGCTDKIEVGDKVNLNATIYPATEPLYEGGFDFRRHFFFKNISGLGYISKFTKIEKTNNPKSNSLDSIRGNLKQKINDNLSEQSAGVALALVMGERYGIDKKIYEDMRISGLAHIVAISGLHMAIVMGGVFLFARLIFVAANRYEKYFDNKKAAALVSIAFGFLYLSIANFPISAQRAYIMYSLFLLSVLLAKDTSSLRAIIFAAILILLIQPEAVVSIGFQLSFIATLALISFYEDFKDKLNNSDSLLIKLRNYIMGSLIATFIASMATAPLVAYHFNYFSTLSLVSNLLISPAFTFVLMPALLAFSVLPFGQSLIAPFIEYSLAFIFGVAEQVTLTPGAGILIPQISDGIFTVIKLLLFFSIIFKGKIRGILILAQIALMFVAVAMVQKPDLLIHDNFQNIAYKNEGGDYTMLKGGTSSFAANQWKQALAISLFVKDICKDYCEFEVADKKIIYQYGDKNLDVACKNADLVLVKWYVDEKPCEHIIDRKAFRDKASISFRFDH